MASATLDRQKDDLTKLLSLGTELETDLLIQELERRGPLDDEHKKLKTKVAGSFDGNYQRWYTEALAVVKQLIPDRAAEFEVLYKGDGRRKEVNAATYTIQDWMTGLRSSDNAATGKKYFNDVAAVHMRYGTQLAILKAAQARFESSLFDLRQVVQADLFDSELDGARELLKHGFWRAAGVIAGVVLEKHLHQVLRNHRVQVKKSDPGISDLNDLLKNSNILDVPSWRFNQRLADLRNLCGHNKGREPSDAEVKELIDGVDKVSKTLF